MNKLEDAIILACEQHRGQVDKANKPYILHLLRVMLKMQSEEEMIVGVLHDILEDTGIRIWDLCKLEFNNNQIESIMALTRNTIDGEKYFEYIERCKKNNIARKVKLADAIDNSDLTRLDNISKKDINRNKRYLKSIKLLKEI